MRNINPIHIILLFIVVFIFILFSLNNVKKDLNKALQMHDKKENIAVHLVSLKTAYKNKNELIKSLNKILVHPSLNKYKIQKTMTKKGIILGSNTLNKGALNYFMSKVLNTNYKIHSYKIKKIDEKYLGLKMEIRW